MGALEMLEQQFTMTDDARHQVAALSEQGLRVLVLPIIRP